MATNILIVIKVYESMGNYQFCGANRRLHVSKTMSLYIYIYKYIHTYALEVRATTRRIMLRTSSLTANAF